MDNEVLDEPKQCPDFRGTAMDPHKGASHCAHLQGCQMPVRRKPVPLFGWNYPCEVWVSVQVFKPFSARAVLVRLWSPPCSRYHLPPSTASLWISASTWNAALSSKAMLRGTEGLGLQLSCRAWLHRQIAHEHFRWERAGFFATISLFASEMVGLGKCLLTCPNRRIKSSTSQEHVSKS